MKKLLLLFIPIIFLWSCGNDNGQLKLEENNNINEEQLDVCKCVEKNTAYFKEFNNFYRNVICDNIVTEKDTIKLLSIVEQQNLGEEKCGKIYSTSEKKRIDCENHDTYSKEGFKFNMFSMCAQMQKPLGDEKCLKLEMDIDSLFNKLTALAELFPGKYEDPDLKKRMQAEIDLLFEKHYYIDPNVIEITPRP